jgi:hypothetical protein
MQDVPEQIRCAMDWNLSSKTISIVWWILVARKRQHRKEINSNAQSASNHSRTKWIWNSIAAAKFPKFTIVVLTLSDQSRWITYQKSLDMNSSCQHFIHNFRIDQLVSLVYSVKKFSRTKAVLVFTRICTFDHVAVTFVAWNSHKSLKSSITLRHFTRTRSFSAQSAQLSINRSLNFKSISEFMTKSWSATSATLHFEHQIFSPNMSRCNMRENEFIAASKDAQAFSSRERLPQDICVKCIR